MKISVNLFIIPLDLLAEFEKYYPWEYRDKNAVKNYLYEIFIIKSKNPLHPMFKKLPSNDPDFKYKIQLYFWWDKTWQGDHFWTVIYDRMKRK